MALSRKLISFLLLSLLCVSVCSASRSTFGDEDPKKTSDEDPKKTNALAKETTDRSKPDDDKKNNAETQVTISAVAYSGGGGVFTSSGGGYTSGNCGSSSCNNGGGSGSMSGCGSSCSNGGGACMSSDCNPSPCPMPTLPCQIPVHCTPQCSNVQPVQTPCTPQYLPQPTQPQSTPCNTCNQQSYCPNDDCGNGGYHSVKSIETDGEDPYYEKEDSEPKTKKPDGDGGN